MASRKSTGAGHLSRVTKRAVVLHVARKTNTDASRSEKSRLEEAVALTAAIGLEVAHGLIASIAKPTPATLVGTGKVQEIKTLCADLEP